MGIKLKATREQIRTAIGTRVDLKVRDIANMIGYRPSDVLPELRKMVADGLVKKRTFDHEALYTLVENIAPPTPAPYPRIVMQGEWRPNWLQHYRLNRRGTE